jgi:predicted nucleotidyltransferase
MSSESMKASEIRAMLAEVEGREHVRVCLAVESGSRAWGFPSADSDYDVRFVYAHHPDWYLSIDDGRDVIERPLTNMIDLSGWELRKALRLFRKSNPPLLEWLQCPIVYAERSSLASTLRTMLPRCFSAEASFHHYLHMSQGNFREYLRGDVVRPKKYFYVLRPLLAMRWLEGQRGPVPIEFARLLDATIPAPDLRAAIDALMDAKAAGQELDNGPRIPIISDFIEHELARFETQEARRSNVGPDTDELNALFRRTLDEVFPISL